MTKAEIKLAVNDLRDNVHYEGVSTEPLYGLALDDFPYGKYVRHEVVVNLLHWQCMFLDGTIDEVSFFTNNTIDISNLYNNGKPGDLSSLSPSIWYRFEEGTGSVANNSGSANNNGTITAAIYSTLVP